AAIVSGLGAESQREPTPAPRARRPLSRADRPQPRREQDRRGIRGGTERLGVAAAQGMPLGRGAAADQARTRSRPARGETSAALHEQADQRDRLRARLRRPGVLHALFLAANRDVAARLSGPRPGQLIPNDREESVTPLSAEA